MNESTKWVGEATKIAPGSYAAWTYSKGTRSTGQFLYRKDGSKWVVSHVDFTTPVSPNERTYTQRQATLKAAKDFAERLVRALPGNTPSREELLRRHAPVSVVGYATAGEE